MNATEELRRMLDERGVEYTGTHPAFTAWWGNHDLYWSAMEVYDGELDLGTNMSSVSPEQAIAATLGADPRERGLIPHFWTGDWTLHIETAKLPERIDVTLPDERGREVRSARVHRFVPERTCHKVRVHMQIEDEMHCSECDRFLGFAGDVGAPPYNFCPSCGARVVDA